MIVFDEVGVGIPARDWYTISNKMLSYVLQTFRYENLSVIFTCSSFDFIDVQTRKPFHTYIETLAISDEKNLVTAKLMEIQNNPKVWKRIFQISSNIY